MTDRPLDDTRELFRALEFAHYAERFRDRIFVIAMPAATPFSELLLDFKVLEGYRIQVVLVTRDVDLGLEQVIVQANKRGSRFHLSLLTDLLFRPEADVLEMDMKRVQTSLEQGRTPVIAYHAAEEGAEGDGGPVDPTYVLGGQVAQRIGARKLFLVHPLAEALRAGLPRSSVQTGELEGLPQRLESLGLPGAIAVCELIARQLARGIPDVVLLGGKSGHLFREVFTYDGAGVLFTASRAGRIRRAEMLDVTDMTLLLRPQMESGRIRPVSEGRIEANIGNYFVYEIDGMLVGLAGLKRHGAHAELTQFATLPRYRGRGRARDLAQFLEQEARKQGFRYVFALSIDPRMWDFFAELGFQHVPRETLPESWRREYDLSRPSRALLKEL